MGGTERRPIYSLEVWTFDPSAERFSKLPTPAGPRPTSAGPIGRWATFWYDRRHNACILVAQLGQGGLEGRPCQTWAYRYRAAAGRPATRASLSETPSRPDPRRGGREP